MNINRLYHAHLPLNLIKVNPNNPMQPDVLIQVVAIEDCERGYHLTLFFPQKPDEGKFALLEDPQTHKCTDVTVRVNDAGEVLWPHKCPWTLRELTPDEQREASATKPKLRRASNWW